MDRHDLAGVTAADIAAAHLKDLDVQGRFGVQFLNYWFDYDRQRAFCLAEGPSQALGKGFAFGKGSRLRLKGFDDPMTAFEVAWAAAPASAAAGAEGAT